MIVPKTLEEINQMIADGVEENISLDYKAADALQNTDGKKKEIAKDVSAMANSAGGVIIYGVKESDDEKRKHLPETITPIDCRTFSKEQLEQIINGNVSPKIEGLLIHPISTGNEFDVVYVVEVPQGDTAHQNTKDRRYYKRQNFISEPMLDHEIRDVMNRSEHPKIELLFEIVKETYETNLEVRPFNIGRVYANYINFFVVLAEELVEGSSGYNNPSDELVEVWGENTHRDYVDSRSRGLYTHTIYGPARFEPVLPGLYGRATKIRVKRKIEQDETAVSEHEITWTVYADNASPRVGSIKLKDIRVIEKEEEY